MDCKEAEESRKASFDFLSASLKGLFLLNGVACTALLASKNFAFLFSKKHLHMVQYPLLFRHGVQMHISKDMQKLWLENKNNLSALFCLNY